MPSIFLQVLPWLDNPPRAGAATMPNRIERLFRLGAGALVAALLLQWPIGLAAADERSELEAAFKLASAQYQVALKTLETSGREETAAEVHRLRAAFQTVIQQV